MKSAAKGLSVFLVTAVLVDEGKGHFPVAPRDPKPVVDFIVSCRAAGRCVRRWMGDDGITPTRRATLYPTG
ncbi:MAG TPA: hypothetical protein VG097_20790 [Gemmata sp.]|nr:hypothetical protein [Gemmata sp.]